MTGNETIAPTKEGVADDERLRGNHVLAPDAGGHHGRLAHITFDLPPTLCYIVHTGGRHLTLQGHVDFDANFWFYIKNERQTPLSHLFAAKVEVEVLEVSEALVREARATQRAGDIGQRGEVVAQPVVALRPHVQLAVAVTGREFLHMKVLRLS